MVGPEDVERGRACNCTCAECGGELIAAQGDKNIWHFRHDKGAVCEHGYETAIHKMAKQLLLEEQRIALPKLEVKESRSVKLFVGAHDEEHTIQDSETLVVGGIVQLIDVRLEDGLLIQGLRPDAVGTWNGRTLLIEIRVHHKVGKVKRERLLEGDWHAIEIDLSKLPHDVTKETLRRRLCEAPSTHGAVKDHWLHHPDEAAARVRVRRALEAKVDEARRKHAASHEARKKNSEALLAQQAEARRRWDEHKRKQAKDRECEFVVEPKPARDPNKPRVLLCDDPKCWKVFDWQISEEPPRCPKCGAEVSLDLPSQRRPPGGWEH
jgi:hypothetical protein